MAFYKDCSLLQLGFISYGSFTWPKGIRIVWKEWEAWSSYQRCVIGDELWGFKSSHHSQLTPTLCVCVCVCVWHACWPVLSYVPCLPACHHLHCCDSLWNCKPAWTLYSVCCLVDSVFYHSNRAVTKTSGESLFQAVSLREGKRGGAKPMEDCMHHGQLN